MSNNPLTYNEMSKSFEYLMNQKADGKMVFVFGSNLSGHHGAGAARDAYLQHGAIRGHAQGLQGESYAIPTKDISMRHTLPLDVIYEAVQKFCDFTKQHPELSFQVTRIGCGLAGLQNSQVSHMFIRSNLDNTFFDSAWYTWLGPAYRYWGHK